MPCVDRGFYLYITQIMTLAILSALPQEQSGLSACLQGAQRHVHAGRTFTTGTLHAQPVVLALSGMGKVAAATTATALIERFGVQQIVFTGVAGGIGEGVNVGDAVIATHYVQHDLDVSPLFPRWEVPGYGRALLECDKDLSDQLLQATRLCLGDAEGFLATRRAAPQVHYGTLASGDQFIALAEHAQRLRGDLQAGGHRVLAVEMEGAAVAQVCLDYGVTFAAVRTISDRAADSAHIDFTDFLNNVASKYAERIVQALICGMQK